MWRTASALFNSFFKYRVGFQDLPLELLFRIASYLGFLDVISFRQTSRRLRDATETRSLWIALAAEYCTRQLNYPRPPTGAFRTEELCKWVTERCIVNEIWKKPGARPRSVNLTRSCKSFAVAIVPGGRWALLGNYNGYIHAYDFCSEDPRPSPLIKPQRGVVGTDQAVLAIAISVDSQSPILQFIVAFTGHGPDPLRWLHIWQVRLESNDLLSAQKLLSIPCSNYGPKLSLSDNLVARTFVPSWSLETWAEVFQWKECSAKHITKSTIRMKCKPEFIQVIGNDRILCVDPQQGVYIYDIPEPDTVQYKRAPIPLYHKSAPVCGHAWFHPLEPSSRWGYSLLYFDGVYFRQVIGTSHGILGLVVPASKKELPYMVKLADPPLEEPIFYCLGLHKGCAALWGGGVRYGYSWGKGFPEGPIYRNGHEGKIDRDNGWFRAAFDEEAGRSVWISSKRAALVDFNPDPALI